MCEVWKLIMGEKSYSSDYEFCLVLQAACHMSLKWWSLGIMSWPSIRISWRSWSSRITIAFPPSPSWNPRTLTMFSLSWQTVFTCRTRMSLSRDFEYMAHHGKLLMPFLAVKSNVILKSELNLISWILLTLLIWTQSFDIQSLCFVFCIYHHHLFVYDCLATFILQIYRWTGFVSVIHSFSISE